MEQRDEKFLSKQGDYVMYMDEVDKTPQRWFDNNSVIGGICEGVFSNTKNTTKYVHESDIAFNDSCHKVLEMNKARMEKADLSPEEARDIMNSNASTLDEQSKKNTESKKWYKSIISWISAFGIAVIGGFCFLVGIKCKYNKQ